ncbi:hypothetical protein [Shewanella youngdeokensis]|uniref:DUF3887 domain-containing protein n=1 Tax=Shewanella youngdeokensis TaxID=2999068 RepID=A0ABZ0JUI4_9GAMM|nr:hypothetical protein RGE70_11495 [Shewanella sp. DAU334]
MKNLITGIALCCLSFSSTAYEGSPKSQVAAYFSDLVAGKYSTAIDSLYSSNPLMASKAQQLTLLKQQVSSVPALYGKLHGYETLSHEELSPSLVRIVTIAKHQNHPVNWEFYFYKINSTWVVSHGTFGDQFQYIGKKK